MRSVLCNAFYRNSKIVVPYYYLFSAMPLVSLLIFGCIYSLLQSRRKLIVGMNQGKSTTAKSGGSAGNKQTKKGAVDQQAIFAIAVN